MKRVFSAILILLLIASLPAVAEQSFSTFDYVTGSAGGVRFIYYDFPDVTLNLPAEWQGLYTVEQDETGVTFCQTASHEKYLEEGIKSGGFLFKLCASEDEGFRGLPAYEYLGYSENAGLHFYLMLPSDYPAYVEDDAVKAEYDRMSGDIIPVVAGKARVAPNMSFYPGDIELDGNDLA